MNRLPLLWIALAPLCALGAGWTVRVEEPTGLYPRKDEVVRVPLTRLGGNRAGFQVMTPAGRELPWQVTQDALLFPVSLQPGELPQYRIACCTAGSPRNFDNTIVAQRHGVSRLEIGNARFRLMIDLKSGAVVQAIHFGTAPEHSLNLVDLSPDDEKTLRTDMHASPGMTIPQAAGVDGPNSGWTSLGGTGEFTRIDVVESGPLEGRVHLARAGGDTWDLTWTSTGRWIRWRAPQGFRFASLSASPLLPFNRFLDGSEYEWPQGPSNDEPPNHDVGARAWNRPPGGHGVYYRNDADYGALGIVALDAGLEWRGLGSRRFEARKPAGGDSEIALTFPDWKGNWTVMEARRECRMLKQALLVQVAEATDAVAMVDALADAPVAQATSEPLPRFTPNTLPLDGEWELAWGEKGAGPTSEWRKVKVPGSAHLQWLPRNQVYTTEANWVSEKEWWYRRSFRVPASFQAKRVRLAFEATDYYADVFINGVALGRHEGYIDPWDVDLTPHLRTDRENEILVRVWTPVSYYWRHRPYTVKGSYGAVDQKPDDITPLGITRPVRLVAGEVSRISDIGIVTRLTGAESAEVEVSLDGEALGKGQHWELALRPRNFRSSESYRLTAPAEARRATFHLDKAHLWWTWDHGKPNLYTLDAQLVDAAGQVIDSRSFAVGIREFERIGWTFYLNRKRLFLRGTNYYYNLFLSEMTREAYARDVELMKRMSVNTIRLHCHFTNREFYDLADENGILIWQDFLEAWYPHDTAFSLRAAALYRPHIRMVRNHPSIAIWATSDEEDLENYADLTKHLEPIPFFEDPQRRPVVRSTGRFGDAHVYYGWYEGSVWQYASMDEQLVSELGATSLPNYESLIKFMPNAWPIRGHEDEWIFHKLQIPEAMRAWGDPAGMTLQEYIPRTQAYVARLFQIALERARRQKYNRFGGIFHFHAIDIWPSVTMAAIDYYRVPTDVYRQVQRSFAPVGVSIEFDRDEWKSGDEIRCPLWAINDEWQAHNGLELRWRIVPEKGEVVHAQGSLKADLAEDSSARLGEAVWKTGAPGRYQLRAELVTKQGSSIANNVYRFEVK